MHLTPASSLLDGIRHIIWDWNGTLLDDAWLCVKIMNGMLERRNLPPINGQIYQELFAFPVRDYYARIGFDFDAESFEVVGTEFIEHYQAEQLACKLQTDANLALLAFGERGFGQSILSASQQTRLNEQVCRLGLRGHFANILGLVDHYAEGKVELGRRCLVELGLKPSEILLIGDTDHDAMVAATLGIRCVLLPRGHQSRCRLATCGKPIFESLDAILDS